MWGLSRVIITGSLALGIAGTAYAADDNAIRAFEDAQQASWNAHDAKAYAAAFSDDATVTNSLGWHWTGCPETQRTIGDGFMLVYAHSQLQLTVAKVRLLSPDIALVNLTWSMTGALTPDGAAPAGQQQGVETQLLQRRGDRWLILSQQDTATVPMPAPTSIETPKTATSETTFPTKPPPVKRCVLGRSNGDCLVYGKPKPATQ